MHADHPTPAPSRRRFLQTTAAAVAAAGAAPLAFGAHAGGTDMLKVGLVGCGGRGGGAAENALKGDKYVKLWAMADAFPDRIETKLHDLQEFSAQIDVPPERRFAGFDAYKHVIDCCDVVLLATPPHFRPIHLKAAVAAGKHVFCEKPMAVDAPGVRSVMASIAEAKAKGTCLMSGFCFRYEPSKRETVARLRGGAIGDILAIQANYNTGPIWAPHPRKPGWSDMEYQVRNWYYYTWLSGDHNVEQHVHNLDKASWVLGDAVPLAAHGTGGRQVRTDPKYGNIFDHHSVVYEFPNGVKVFSNCRQMAGCENDVSDHVIGTEGSCQLMDHVITGERAWKYKGPKPNMYQQEHDELFAAIRAGKVVSDAFMANSTLIAIMGRMATYTGKKVTWEEALNSKEDLSPPAYDMSLSLPVPPVAMPGKTKLV
jgi:predicted dehydrogenase